ncbi:MAG: class I SAM-dependent methyltransferase [Haloglomus sp.]
MREALYAAHPEAYDALYAEKSYAAEAAWVLDRFEAVGSDGDRALVVGCGTGEHDRHLLEAGFDVTGVDRYEAMVERAREKNPDATYATDALPDLSVEGRYDLVWAPFTVVNHLPRSDLGAAVRAMADRLAPGGLLLFDTLDVDFEDGDGDGDRDGESPARFRAHPDPGGDGFYARLVQNYETDEGRYRWDSLVLTPDGEWFVDRHTLTSFDPAFVAGVVAGAGLSPTVHDEWYGTGDIPGHAVFEGRADETE